MINTNIASPTKENVEIVYRFPIKHANFADVREIIENTVDKSKSSMTIVLGDDVCKLRARLASFVNSALYDRI